MNIIEKLGITPEPWDFVPCSNFSGTWVSYILDDKAHPLFQSRHSSLMFDRKECDSDTALAAAAPKMLEALIACVARYEKTGKPQVWESMYEAIEKATGKEWTDVKALTEETK